MKKIAFLFVIVCAVYALAQNKPAQDNQAQDKPHQEKTAASSKIQVTMTSISLEENGPTKEDMTFHEGDLIFINLEVKGLQANDKKEMAIQVDIMIPQLNIDKKNIIDSSTPAEEVVPMFVQIPIGPIQKDGLCYVTITVRDMIAKTFTEFRTEFKLETDKKVPPKLKKK